MYINSKYMMSLYFETDWYDATRGYGWWVKKCRRMSVVLIGGTYNEQNKGSTSAMIARTEGINILLYLIFIPGMFLFPSVKSSK